MLIFSHHNSLTLENRASRPGLDQPLHGADEFLDLLLRYPVVVGWLNGHTHLNQILAHRGPTAAGSGRSPRRPASTSPSNSRWWRSSTTGTARMSLFTTVLDHASPGRPRAPAAATWTWPSQSRELAANDWAETPLMRRGSPLDRNTELLLPAPFDLSADHRRRRWRPSTRPSGPGWRPTRPRRLGEPRTGAAEPWSGWPSSCSPAARRPRRWRRSAANRSSKVRFAANDVLVDQKVSSWKRRCAPPR